MTSSTPTPPTTIGDREAWAHPVDRLTTTATTTGLDTVTGKRVAGPVQGFGQMWQKTFRVGLTGSDLGPADVIARWKAEFPAFWPKSARFYAPLSGIAPGEVALLEVQPMRGSPVRMSTGVMVIYSDAESFTFMTPEGHMLSAWITFSAYRDGEMTVAQVQALERTSDPFIELTYLLGASRVQDRFWVRTLENLAIAFGVDGPVVERTVVCVDKRRQWGYARNLRFSPMVSMVVGAATAPARWLRGRGR